MTDHELSPATTAPSGQWLKHAGGQCPLGAGAKFDALHRDGSVTVNRTAQVRYRWDHHGTPCDIVAYRRAQPPHLDRASLAPSE